MIKRFIRYYRPHIKLFIIDMVCALTVAFIDLLFPIVTNKVLREYIPQGLIRIVVLVGLVLFFLYIFRFFLSYIIGYWGHVMGIRIETDMRGDLFH